MVALWHIHGIHGGMIHWNILWDAWILGFCQRPANYFFLKPLPPKNETTSVKVPRLEQVKCFSFVHIYEVLMVSLGLTMFISTLYGHIFSSWDSSFSMRPWETVAEDDVPEMSNMQGGKVGSWQLPWVLNHHHPFWVSLWGGGSVLDLRIRKMKRFLGGGFCLKVWICVFCRSLCFFWFLTNKFLERSVWVLPLVQWQGCCWSPSSLPSLKVCYGCWLLHSSVVLWHVHACKNDGMYRHPLGRGK